MDQKLTKNLKVDTWYKTRGGRRALVTLVTTTDRFGHELRTYVAEGVIYDEGDIGCLGDVAFWWAHAEWAGMQYANWPQPDDLVELWANGKQLELFSDTVAVAST